MPTFKYKPTATFQNTAEWQNQTSRQTTYTNTLYYFVERFHWKSSAQECTCNGYTTLAAMRDQFIAGLGRFWKCGPMWFTISLDPPHLLEEGSTDYRTSNLRHDQPPLDMLFQSSVW